MFADKSSSFSTGKINKRPSFDPNAPAGMKIVPHAWTLDPDPRIFRSACLEPEKKPYSTGGKKKRKRRKASSSHEIFAKFRRLKLTGIIKAQCESILREALNQDSRVLYRELKIISFEREDYYRASQRDKNLENKF